MMTGIIERVYFRLNADATEAALLEASKSVDKWVGSQPGFEYRALSQLADGTWQDVVFWATMEDALRAGEAFTDAQETLAMIACIDADSVVMELANIHSTLCASEVVAKL